MWFLRRNILNTEKAIFERKHWSIFEGISKLVKQWSAVVFGGNSVFSQLVSLRCQRGSFSGIIFRFYSLYHTSPSVIFTWRRTILDWTWMDSILLSSQELSTQLNFSKQVNSFCSFFFVFFPTGQRQHRQPF